MTIPTTADTKTAPALSRFHGWALALIATFTMAVSYVDRQALAAIAPTVTKALEISETQFGWLVSAFSLAYLVASPFAGSLIDRMGARRGLLWAVLLWSSFAGLHALVPSFGVLLALRIALGVTEAPSLPGAAQTIQRVLPPASRGRGFGIMFTGSSVGAIIASLLAPWLEKRWGFRIAFLGTALVGLTWIPLWIAFAFRRDAIAVLEGASTKKEKPASAFVVARHPAVVRAALGVMASAPAVGFVLNWGSKYLVSDRGILQANVGKYLIIPPLLFDVGSILFGHLLSTRADQRKNGEPDRLLFGIAMVLALGIIVVPFGRTPYESMLIAGVGLAGCGGIFAMLLADLLGRVSPAVVSTAGGICAAAQSIAYIVWSPIMGKLIQTTGAYTVPFMVIGSWMIPGCVAWMLWRPPPPYREQTA